MNRMNMIAGVKKGDKLWLNPYITSIFHVIYMQYKINQGLVKVQIANQGRKTELREVSICVILADNSCLLT